VYKKYEDLEGRTPGDSPSASSLTFAIGMINDYLKGHV
jgi:hypothetical protein